MLATSEHTVKPSPPRGLRLVSSGGSARVDGRTKAGRYLRDIENGLLADLGPTATTAQRVLARIAAVKTVRLSQIELDVLGGEACDSATDYQRLAWLGSLSNDLAALSGKPGDGKGYRNPANREASRPAGQRDGGALAAYAAQRKGAA